MCCIAKSFQPMFYNQYVSKVTVKSFFVDSLEAEQTIFSMGKISFSLKLLSGHIMGNPAKRLMPFSRINDKLSPLDSIM